LSALINGQWRLISRPEGIIAPQNFEWREERVPELPDGNILMRTTYLSLDPASRLWANAEETYVPPVPINDVMRGTTLGEVVESRHPDFSPGDIALGRWGWQQYAIVDPESLLVRIPSDEGLPLPVYMAVVGIIGFTAYIGLLDVAQLAPGETVVVTGAAGAVGSLAGQIAKIKGCRVVGVAGTPEKCEWLVESLGFDAAINYKTDDVPKALAEHCPAGIDVVFENVGGPVLDAILERINFRARIAVCGLIAQYNADKPVPGPYNFHMLLMKRARVEGFIVLDYASRFPEARAALVGWLREGKLKYRTDIVEGLENAPAALSKLYDGTNKGKLMVRVSEDPTGLS